MILVWCMPTAWRAIWPQILKSMLFLMCPFVCVSCLLYVTWCAIGPQSAELQKKLHHLEVQLNNEKQHMGDLEHKYRYCGNITWTRVQGPGDRRSTCSDWLMMHTFNFIDLQGRFDVWKKSFAVISSQFTSVVYTPSADLSVTGLRKSPKNMRKR